MRKMTVCFAGRAHIFCWLAVAAVITASAAVATPVHGTPVGAANFSGFRYLADDLSGGLDSAGTGPGWNFFEGNGIQWTITQNLDGSYTYSYRFFSNLVEGQPGDSLEMSHFILELSPGCVVRGQSECIRGFEGSVEFREDWGPSPSNPGIPGTLYGVKFDEGLATYTFVSDRIPVWGNFYAKKGTDGLWNLGLEPANADSDNVLYFIARPDTEQMPPPEIPEPGTMALLGAGLAALGLIRRRS